MQMLVGVVIMTGPVTFINYQLCTPTKLFFFNNPPTTEIYTLSLHDALPICQVGVPEAVLRVPQAFHHTVGAGDEGRYGSRSEEHTSELQSLTNLVCRLLLEKKKRWQTESAAT